MNCKRSVSGSFSEYLLSLNSMTVLILKTEEHAVPFQKFLESFNNKSKNQN